MMNDLSLDCKWKNLCQSCSATELSLPAALGQKRSELEQGLQQNRVSSDAIETEMISVGPYGFRNRVDLVWADGKLSFYDQNRKTFALDECPLLVPELNQLLEKVRNLPFSMKKGSMRLRVSPEGEFGVWLDLANLDVKALFVEKTLLLKLSQIATVEIGQRRKSLVFENGEPKLRDPVMLPWTSTFIGGKPVHLYSAIGSFSQTSIEANQKISAWIETALTEVGAKSVIEFGSGTGTLTFPAAGTSRQVLACENDELALGGLQTSLSSLRKNSSADFDSRIEILSGDFQQKKFELKNSYDTFLINPPRSGMGKFHETLSALPSLPKHGVYMSCFLESFLKDSVELQRLGYRLERLAIVDQFPFTHHFEILSSWSLV